MIHRITSECFPLLALCKYSIALQEISPSPFVDTCQEETEDIMSEIGRKTKKPRKTAIASSPVVMGDGLAKRSRLCSDVRKVAVGVDEL